MAVHAPSRSKNRISDRRKKNWASPITDRQPVDRVAGCLRGLARRWIDRVEPAALQPVRQSAGGTTCPRFRAAWARLAFARSVMGPREVTDRPRSTTNPRISAGHDIDPIYKKTGAPRLPAPGMNIPARLCAASFGPTPARQANLDPSRFGEEPWNINTRLRGVTLHAGDVEIPDQGSEFEAASSSSYEFPNSFT